MKIMYLSVLILCTVVLLSAPVSGYSIYPTSEGSVKVIEIRGDHTITKKGDLESKLMMRFYVISGSARDITLHFEPFERITAAPIKDVYFSLCEGSGSYGWRADTGYSGRCDKYDYKISNYTSERAFVHEGIVSAQNYTWYGITFSPKEADENQRFVLLINYTQPNFIFENGDYSVAWLTLPNMKDKELDIANTIILPSEDDVPRFFENAEKINRYGYNERGKWLSRWTFTYLGRDDIILWYLNDQEIKEREEALQNRYMIIGVVLGFVLTRLRLFWRILVFDLPSFGNRVYVWFVGKFRLRSVIGNSKNKKYHKYSCGHVKKIHEKNKMKFRTSRVAEENGYTPCGVCCIDK